MKLLDSILAMGRTKPAPEAPTSSASTPAPSPATAGPAPAADTPAPENERERILAIVKKHFEPIKVGMAAVERQPATPVPPQLILEVARTIEGPLLDDQQLAEARRLATEYEAAVSGLRGVTTDKAALAYDQSQKASGEAVVAGRQAEGWTKQDFREDFATRGNALKIAARQRSAEAGELFGLAAAKVIQVLRTRAEEAAISEYRTHVQYGIDFVPSVVVRTLLASAGSLQRTAMKLTSPGGIGMDPRSMFALLAIEL